MKEIIKGTEEQQPKQESTETFGSRLKQIRQNIGYSQRSVANVSGLHHSCLSRLESGKKTPALSTANKIADALSLSPLEKLLLYEPSRSPSEIEAEFYGYLKAEGISPQPITEISSFIPQNQITPTDTIRVKIRKIETNS